MKSTHEYPEAILRALRAKPGIAFEENMLSWPPIHAKATVFGLNTGTILSGIQRSSQFIGKNQSN